MLRTAWPAAGGKAEFLIAAKDAKGVRKSLGGDVFTVSWTRAGRTEAPMTGMVGAYGAAQPDQALCPDARRSVMLAARLFRSTDLQPSCAWPHV